MMLASCGPANKQKSIKEKMPLTNHKSSKLMPGERRLLLQHVSKSARANDFPDVLENAGGKELLAGMAYSSAHNIEVPRSPAVTCKAVASMLAGSANT